MAAFGPACGGQFPASFTEKREAETRSKPRGGAPMYIGIGTVVVIVLIILLILFLRR